jgi:hypothetical protein
VGGTPRNTKRLQLWLELLIFEVTKPACQVGSQLRRDDRLPFVRFH